MLQYFFFCFCLKFEQSFSVSTLRIGDKSEEKVALFYSWTGGEGENSWGREGEETTATYVLE